MKKYILKPGKHQFAPGSPSVHTNENLTDEEAEWYMAKYPHIVALFTSIPQAKIPPTSAELTPKRKRKRRPLQDKLINP